jgi:4-amino-4-deoxy-L-arabinose transferase-like glycosyltransferase
MGKNSMASETAGVTSAETVQMKYSKRDIILFLTVLAISIFMRVYLIDADPPLDPRQGQSLSTDPPQYIHYAANKVDFGTWDNETRTSYLWHHHNLYTPFAFGVFKILGAGLTQGNLIGVFFNILSLVLLFWIVSHRLGVFFGLVAMLILGVNYEFIKIGRLAYLENIQVFCLLLAIALLEKDDNSKKMIFLAGFAISVGVFFCKLSSVISAVGVVVSLALYQWLTAMRKLKEIFRNLIIFVAGFAAVALIWVFSAYLPTIERTWNGAISASYFTRASAMDSPTMFIVQLYSLFTATKFVLHAPVQALLAAVFIALVVVRFILKRKSLTLQEYIWPLSLFFLFASIFGWEWRPLRYQIILSPMLAAAVVWALHYLVEGKIAVKERAGAKIAFFAVSVLLASIIWFSIIGVKSYHPSMGMAAFWKTWTNSALLSLLSAALFYFLFFGNNKGATPKRGNFIGVKVFVISLLVVGCVLLNVGLYFSWAKSPRYTIKEAIRSAGVILNKNAYLIGSYAPLLTIDNGIRSDTPLWGSDRIPRILDKFPATHIVQEANGPLMKILEEDYPGIRSKSQFLGYLIVRGFTIELWRLPPDVSQRAQKYTLSDFEKAMALGQSGRLDEAKNLLLEIESKHGKVQVVDEVRRSIDKLLTP